LRDNRLRQQSQEARALVAPRREDQPSLEINNEPISPTGNDWWRDIARWYFDGHLGPGERDRPLKRAVDNADEREKVRSAERLTPKELANRTVYRRAVDAVIWGLPLVGEDTVKQAAFRDGKANYNDIVWWPKGGGWKNQSPTPNVNTRYIYWFINTRQDGPVVVEIPPAVTGASFYGTIEDAWYVPLIDLGFEGKGGKYLVLPPDYKGDVPDGG
jgi:hypothetical protein